MGVTNFEIQENSFNSKATNSYDLSILIGVDRFSYLLNDAQQNVIALHSYTYKEQYENFHDLLEPIKKIYLEDKRLKLSYLSVKISLMVKGSTLIPSQLYKEEDNAIYLENLIQNHRNEIILLDDIDNLQIKNVFAVDSEILNTLKSYFPTARFFHGQTSILLGFNKLATLQTGQRVYLCVKDRMVQLVYFNDKELIFSNFFTFQTAKDFIYYVLLIYDQFNLKPETIPLTVAGKIVEESKIYHLLYRYIRHLNIVKAPTYLHFGKGFGSTAKHLYFDLYSLKLCE